MGRGVGAQGRVGCVRRVDGVRGNRRVGGVGAEGQRGGVDVVVVHHRAGQHQLEQTVEANTQGSDHG